MEENQINPELGTQTESEIMNRELFLEDITEATKCSPDGKTFLEISPEGEIKPIYAKEIAAIYLLMNWPMIGNYSESETGISLYACLIQHGKKYIAEVFLAQEDSGKHLGTTKVYSLTFPLNQYSKDYDDWLMDELATRVLGKREEKVMAHQYI